MMKTVHFFITFLILSVAPSVKAQRLEDGSSANIERSITLDDAIFFAYSNNHSISAAQSGIDAAIHRKKAAWGLSVPSLSVGANYTYMSDDVGHIDLNPQKNKLIDFIGSSGVPIPPQVVGALKQMDLSYTLQKRDFAIVDASLVVPIFTGGKISAANKAAKIGISQARNEMLESRSKLFVEVAEFYWGLQLAHHIEHLQNGLVASMTLHSGNAVQLEQNGIIATSDRLFADMALSQSKAAFITSQNNTKTINTALGGALGTSGKYNPITPLFINRNIESLEFFKQLSLNNSNTLEKVELIKQLAKQAVRMERSNFFPTIGAMGVATLWNYNLSDQLPRWLVGATIRWNLFNGLTREQSFMAAKDQVRVVESLQLKAQVDIQTLVEKIYNQMVSAVAQVDACQSTIVFAEQYLTIQIKAFSEGMATSSNVIDAQLNLNKARVERMAAAYSYDVSLAQLLSLSGMPEQFSQYQIGDGYETIY